jgi:serine/threonine protein kinase
MAPRPDVLEQPDFDNYEADDRWSITDLFSRISPDYLLDRVAKRAFRGRLDFMMSNVHFHDNVDENHAWKPVRIIGEGGFGAVGLFQKKSTEDDSIIDELAIKQQKDLNEDWFSIPGRRGLRPEAVIAHDLVSHHGSQNVLPLRRFKRFADSHCRFYFIYCPHQDLEVLKMKYRLFSTHFPELFLWHVFYGLIEAAAALQKPPPAGTKEVLPQDLLGRYFTIHGDLKAGNILLDYSPDDPHAANILSQYPVIRMADFGYSRYTSPTRDAINPHELWRCGTDGYMPPEQRGYGAAWTMAPSGVSANTYALNAHQDDVYIHLYRADPQIVLTHKMNVYAVGAIMYELTFLKSWGELERDMTQDELAYKSYSTPTDNPGHSHRWEEFRTGRNPEYSTELLDAIYRCLTPAPSSRPTASAVLRNFKSHGYLEREIEKAVQARPDDAKDTPGPGEKVYFEANTINDMPVGDARCVYNRDEHDYLVGARDCDPNWPMLVYPADGPLRNKWPAIPVTEPREWGQYEIIGGEIPWHKKKESIRKASVEELDYFATMTVRQMQAELRHRRVPLKELRNLRKPELAQRLHAEDRKGNKGRGIPKGEMARRRLAAAVSAAP